MPLEALISETMPPALDVCPRCAAHPFQHFLRGQVARFDWFGLRRGRIWAVICRRCKDIVDWEVISRPTLDPPMVKPIGNMNDLFERGPR